MLAIVSGHAPGLNAIEPGTVFSFNSQETELSFEMSSGPERSYFLRQRAAGSDAVMASQLRIISGTHPLITVSWPGGNAGVHLQLSSSPLPVDLKAKSVLTIADGGAKGIRATLVGRMPTASPTSIKIEQILEGPMRSIRAMRDYQALEPLVVATGSLIGGDLQAERLSVDRLTRFTMTLRPLGDTRVFWDDESWVVKAPVRKDLQFELTATTTEPPLTPVPMTEILTPELLSSANSRDLAEFAYLVYEQGILGAADDYLTPFGRDSQYLLMIGANGLTAKTFEIVFTSLFEGMREDGNLMHEPSVGEYAAILSMKEGGNAVRTVRYDYSMVDTAFLLAPCVEQYLVKAGIQRAAEFLKGKTSGGLAFREALAKNFRFVLARTEPFARRPQWCNLVALEPGRNKGNWRDSEEGLAGGKYPMDVNLAFVSAALGAIVAVSKKLPGLDLESLACQAQDNLSIWTERAWPYFLVSIPGPQIPSMVQQYASEIGLNTALVSARQPDPANLDFLALSLSAIGKPVPILSSDGAFLLMYDRDLSEGRVLAALSGVAREFPEGLYSLIGIFVSTGTYAPDEIRKSWNFDGYHQLTIWPYQQFLLARGIAAQLERKDLATATTRELEQTEIAVWKAIYNNASFLNLELYTGSPRAGGMVARPYQPPTGHSFSIIMSTAKLALLIPPPKRVTDKLGKLKLQTE